ncbi:MAG: DUF1292 domain-containing protein [Ruthenibacterium sp.]
MADNQENEIMEDYDPDIITLTDEEGKEFSFEVIDAADYNDTRYLAVVPYSEDSAEELEEDANLIIMRVNEEDGEEYLDVVDDDDELYEIGGMFAQRLSEIYDIDPEDLV